jgi:hypothetical protein
MPPSWLRKGVHSFYYNWLIARCGHSPRVYTWINVSGREDASDAATQDQGLCHSVCTGPFSAPVGCTMTTRKTASHRTRSLLGAKSTWGSTVPSCAVVSGSEQDSAVRFDRSILAGRSLKDIKTSKSASAWARLRLKGIRSRPYFHECGCGQQSSFSFYSSRISECSTVKLTR